MSQNRNRKEHAERTGPKESRGLPNPNRISTRTPTPSPSPPPMEVPIFPQPLTGQDPYTSIARPPVSSSTPSVLPLWQVQDKSEPFQILVELYDSCNMIMSLIETYLNLYHSARRLKERDHRNERLRFRLKAMLDVSLTIERAWKDLRTTHEQLIKYHCLPADCCEIASYKSLMEASNQLFAVVQKINGHYTPIANVLDGNNRLENIAVPDAHKWGLETLRMYQQGSLELSIAGWQQCVNDVYLAMEEAQRRSGEVSSSKTF